MEKLTKEELEAVLEAMNENGYGNGGEITEDMAREAFDHFCDRLIDNPRIYTFEHLLECFTERYRGVWFSQAEFAETHAQDYFPGFDDPQNEKFVTYFDYEAYGRDLFIQDYLYVIGVEADYVFTRQ